MPDTPRTISQLLSALADNTTGLITPQVMRDLVLTLSPSRADLLTTGTPSATPIATQNTWTPLVGSTIIRSDVATADLVTNGSGILEYTGQTPRIFYIAATVEINSQNNNQQLAFTFAKNGTADATYESHFFYGSGSRPAAVPLHGLLRLAQGDELSLVVKNETSDADVTLVSLNMSIIGYPE
jgi:hypothetical protein